MKQRAVRTDDKVLPSGRNLFIWRGIPHAARWQRTESVALPFIIIGWGSRNIESPGQFSLLNFLTRWPIGLLERDRCVRSRPTEQAKMSEVAEGDG